MPDLDITQKKFCNMLKTDRENCYCCYFWKQLWTR